jgi:hypothetical protein
MTVERGKKKAYILPSSTDTDLAAMLLETFDEGPYSNRRMHFLIVVDLVCSEGGSYFDYRFDEVNQVPAMLYFWK